MILYIKFDMDTYVFVIMFV